MQTGQRHDKFVPTQTGDGIDFPHAGTQAICHFDKQQVTHGVPILVVERLEVIEIKQHQRTVHPRATAAGNGLYQTIVQQSTVGKLRQAVVLRTYFSRGCAIALHAAAVLGILMYRKYIPVPALRRHAHCFGSPAYRSRFLVREHSKQARTCVVP
ncbi:hypothetical protein Cenrod_1226 [Candidatus Symbiobacter mobilis CR]|uniref:Uncharacterized protein n=1 Tax=Candidatus Symbiobacter mobilis CR TaxID=946483 RepID=U5NAN0_9BURK|nr:hypothetical protein Cenrod_1226 [Candidatus Symbiobacter mobilis CR]